MAIKILFSWPEEGSRGSGMVSEAPVSQSLPWLIHLPLRVGHSHFNHTLCRKRGPIVGHHHLTPLCISQSFHRKQVSLKLGSTRRRLRGSRKPWGTASKGADLEVTATVLKSWGLLTVVCLLPLTPMRSHCSAGLRAEQSPARELAVVVLNGRSMITSVAVLGEMVFFWGSMRLGSKVLNIKSILPELCLCPRRASCSEDRAKQMHAFHYGILASNLL